MSAERNIAEELDNILTCIKKAEQKIIAYDSPDKLKIVSKLVGLEDSVKSIRNDVVIPTLNVTKDTPIKELQNECLISVRVGNSLRRAGCKTVNDILKHTQADIKTMRYMGKKGSDEILNFLNENGFEFTGKTDNK